jgi:hypothetical protein
MTMVDEHIQRLLSEGSDLMNFATGELDRAEEDVVAFLACTNIKRSINLYLQAFIESHRITSPPNHTPDNLLKMCISIDPKFAVLDFAPLECSHEKSADNYCLAVEKVRECLDLATATSQMVLERINT